MLRPVPGHTVLSLEPDPAGSITATCRCGHRGTVPSKDDAALWWRAHQSTVDMNAALRRRWDDGRC